MLRAVSEFGKRTIGNATICIQCYKHLHIRMCLLRLLDVKISASFLMVLNFGSKFAFARHDSEKPYSILRFILCNLEFKYPSRINYLWFLALFCFPFSGGLVILFSIRRYD